MSLLSIDDGDSRPPYEQLSSQLLRMISSGDLQPGDRLAPIRQLATDLSIAPNTVARAYRDLEQIGVIVSRGRRGTIVAERSAEVAVLHIERQACAAVEAAVGEAVRAGVDPVDVLRMVETQIASLAPPEREGPAGTPSPRREGGLSA